MKTTAEPLNILVVEDNPPDLFLLEETLRSSPLQIGNIYSAERASDSRQMLEKHEVDIVFLDLTLPDSFGNDSLEALRPFVNKIPVIILTGLSDSDVAREMLKQGAQDYLVKGEFTADLLTKAVEYSIERKNAKLAILASEEKYRQLFYRHPLPTVMYEPVTFRLLEVNDAALEKYGYERSEFQALTLADIIAPDDLEDGYVVVATPQTPEHLKRKIWRHKKKNGEIMLVEVTRYMIDYFGEKVMQAQVNDVTEKIRLRKKLEEQQRAKQREITAAVLKAQEKERKALGQELHDNINQILAASRLCLDESMRNKEQRDDLTKMGIRNISLAIEEIRKLSKALIAPAFTRWGLKETIEDMIGYIVMARSLPIRFTMDQIDETQLSDNLKVNIYRIIQEQLNNIIKYAEATSVAINIRSQDGVIHLSIEDDGQGFDPNTRSKGVGITNIHSRAGLFDGKVALDSSPGNGCRLRVSLKIGNLQPA